MAGLEATFTRLAGVLPTRRAGELYGGRTVAYEECLRADTVRLGADTLDGIREALALVLDSARWFIGACAELYTGHFDEAYRLRAATLGTDVLPFADIMRYDLEGPVVWEVETAEVGGSAHRAGGELVSPGDLRLAWSHDASGYDPATTLVVGDCDLIDSPTGLRVRRRDGAIERDLLAVLGDLISNVILNSFDVVPSGGHTPRVTIDDLVVSRE